MTSIEWTDETWRHGMRRLLQSRRVVTREPADRLPVLLVRFRGKRYAVEIAVYVADPLTQEQEAEQRAREIQAELESTMVPLLKREAV